MRKQKIKWRSINIPETLFKKIREMIVYTGHPSVAEYVRMACMVEMDKDRNLFEDEHLE